jgi:hypothetical protein
VVDIEARLKALRADVEEELAIGLEEVRRIAQDGTLRTATALAAGLKSLKRDTAVYGTYHLPSRKRRSSRVFARRLRAIELLSADIVAHRRASAATYGMLAMELELVGLEARVKDVMVDHSQRLEGELQRRVYQKVERVQQALGEALRGFHEALATEQGGEALAAKVRLLTEEAERTGVGGEPRGAPAARRAARRVQGGAAAGRADGVGQRADQPLRRARGARGHR